MAKLARLSDIDVSGKTVFLRVDYNVPIDGEKIRDTIRIDGTLPTIAKLKSAGAKIVIASHLGRPKGKVDPKYSLAPVAKHLGIPLVPTIGPERAVAQSKVKPGEMILLENLRFDPGEEKNDEVFAVQLASGCQVYVTDAFGVLHRAHASTVTLPQRIRPAVAGLLVENEVLSLSALKIAPPRPFIVVIGGAKVSDKIQLLRALFPRADAILVVGAMAFPFIRARGGKTGKSLVEEEGVPLAAEILAEAATKKTQILLPEDVLAGASPDDASPVVCDAAMIPDDKAGYDIGPKTVARYKEALAKANAVFWNGPAGFFEKDAYAGGTKALAETLALLADKKVRVVIGGGDSAAAVRQFGLDARMTHVSTGGGASIEFLEGKPLPGLAALGL